MAFEDNTVPTDNGTNVTTQTPIEEDNSNVEAVVDAHSNEDGTDDIASIINSISKEDMQEYIDSLGDNDTSLPLPQSQGNQTIEEAGSSSNESAETVVDGLGNGEVNPNTVDEAIVEDTNESDESKDKDKQEVPLSSAEELYKQLTEEGIKAAGSVITFKDKEEIVTALQKSVDYTRKTAEIKPYRNAIHSLKEAGLLGNDEELNIMIDAFKGNKDAIAFLMSKHNVNLSEVSDTYTPNKNILTEKEYSFEAVVEELKQDAKYEEVQKITTQWDAKSQGELFDSPQLLQNLLEDVKDGSYEKVNNFLTKQALLGTLDDSLPKIEQYARAYTALFAEPKTTTPKTVIPQTPQARVPNTVPASNRVGGTPQTRTTNPNRVVVNEALIKEAIDSSDDYDDETWLRLFGK